jgi:hypothetical protein
MEALRMIPGYLLAQWVAQAPRAPDATDAAAVTISRIALVVSIFGALLAAGSLGWSIAVFLMQGARPKLTPVVCLLSEGKLFAMPAIRDVSQDARDTSGHLDAKLLVGVEVVNAGRAPFHVIGWAWRTDPAGVRVVEKQPTQGPRPPCDIPPGASRIFVTETGAITSLIRGSRDKGHEPKKVYAYVTSGGREYKSKPFAPEVVAMFDEPE